MTTVLIPDYPTQAAVAAARSLFRSGDKCDVAAPMRRLDRRVKSRSIDRWHDHDVMSGSSADFAATIELLVATGGHEVIAPIGPQSTRLLAEERNRLEGVAAFLVPATPVFDTANDKLATYHLCRKIGIPVPATFALTDNSAVEQAAATLFYPAVVKPRVARGGVGLHFVESATELRQAWERLTATEVVTPSMDFTEPIVQEFIPGPVHDACAVAHKGEVVNALTQIRCLMRPAAGGIGAINLSTDIPEIKAHTSSIVRALGYEGPLQVEYKQDLRDGVFKLLEINPRFWGTLDFSIKLGMDFPGQVRDLALARPVERGQTYPVGARYRFWFPQALEASLQLARIHGWRSLRGIAKGGKPSFRDFDPRDPIPDLVRIARVVRRLVRNGPGDGLRGLPADLVPVYRG
jgi:predicted ATP-grasp superfamily ATP-dependent carboligase